MPVSGSPTHIWVATQQWRTTADANLATALADRLGKSNRLSTLTDSHGRTMLEAARGLGGANMWWANSFGTYLGRYFLVRDTPDYISATSAIWEAEDRLDKNNKVGLRA